MLAQNCESDGSMSGMPGECGRKIGSVPDDAASQSMSTTLSRRCLWGGVDRASPVVAVYISADRHMSRMTLGLITPFIRFLIGLDDIGGTVGVMGGGCMPAFVPRLLWRLSTLSRTYG